ncbi:MAG: hypothetical protein V4601_14535 [Pseudomonadota bacterium]
MDVKPTALERAFALAEAGKSLAVIRETLSREGYDQSHLNSPTIRKQLIARTAAARTSA